MNDSGQQSVVADKGLEPRSLASISCTFLLLGLSPMRRLYRPCDTYSSYSQATVSCSWLLAENSKIRKDIAK